MPFASQGLRHLSTDMQRQCVSEAQSQVEQEATSNMPPERGAWNTGKGGYHSAGLRGHELGRP